VKNIKEAFAQADPNRLPQALKQALETEVANLHGQRLEVFLRTVIKNEQNVPATMGISNLLVNSARFEGIKRMREFISKNHPELTDQYEKFVEDTASALHKTRRTELQQAALPEVTKALDTLSPSVVKPELKDALAKEVAGISPTERELFLRSIIRLESDADVAKAMDYSVRTVQGTRPTAISRVKEGIKARYPALLDEFDLFVENQKRRLGQTSLVPATAKGEIPDVKRVLESRLFARMDAKFKEALAQEISELDPDSQHAFIRLVLLKEKANDVAKHTGVDKREIPRQKSDAIKSLKSRFNKSHPQMLRKLQEFIDAQDKL
jgi:DNA-directed RNA polymerase specialized sigma24 family protein